MGFILRKIIIVLFLLAFIFNVIMFLYMFMPEVLPWVEVRNIKPIPLDESYKDLKSFEVEFLGWVVDYDPNSIAVFYDKHDRFTWVSPVWYYIDENFSLIERTYVEELVYKCREWGVKVLPLIANKGFKRDLIHKILSDPDIRDKVIDDIVKLVIKRGYDGVNIDFENIPPEDRDNLTEFMRLLYLKLKEYDKIVSIDVVAKTSETYSGWSGAYDYSALANYTDLFIIMIYDYHYSGSQPGPISPINWFRKVLEYALSIVPKEKIVAGIPFYGYDWPIGGRGKGVSFNQSISLAEKYGAKIVFDLNSGEATFKYRLNSEEHEVWFQTAKSTELRISIAVEMGIYKFAAWRIGHEDPRTWDVIKRKSN